MIIRAIDIGYGNVKLTLSGSSAGIRTLNFPSEAITSLSTDQKIGSTLFESLDIKEVAVGSTQYKVGIDATRIDSSYSYRALSDNYIDSDDYMALFLGALAYMDVDSIDILVVGLPVELMLTREHDLKSKMVGTHSVEGRSITIHNVKVLHQPLGSFMNLTYNFPDKKELLNATNLIIDVGFYTLDWLTAYGLKPIGERCGGNRFGVSLVLKSILAEIRANIKTNLNNINRIDEAIRQQKLRLDGQTHDINQYISAADPILQQGIKDMLTKLKDTSDIENIILTGGGAPFYEQALAKHFCNYTILSDKDSMFSNVKGFQLVGEIIARQSSLSAA